MASGVERSLGRLVRKHHTDNRRRARVGWGAVGLAVAGLAVAGWAAFLEGPPPAGVLGVALALGALALAARIWRRCRRDRGEVYVVREHGLTRRAAGRLTVVPWTDIAAATSARNRYPLARFLGRDVVCRCELKGGGTLRISGFVEEAELLVSAINGRQRRPAAQREPQRSA
ncbi:hypothetical protein FH609_024580 [Streptomyces sp. 3MP-14]|uniref:PH domain-containing protein n=1 Tax=Streptomyces mimosae TaxID=2586635 RepID=A0A5N6A2K3_9ACTN|nr:MULTISPECIES: hypothetical protein [Streptomyces]KAB8162199.1 hypothetical protein FH607_022155 [Streptomyces mimosae]KAB8173902.1 hypothetical protein FH609_024580 [Streptomyces sp. 3MP-14]